MSKDVHAKQFLMDEIQKILLKEWDPIGIQNIPEAQDEYDSYVSDIYKLIHSKKTESEVFDYLWELETEHMGLSGDRKHTQTIAHKLLQLSAPSSHEEEMSASNYINKSEENGRRHWLFSTFFLLLIYPIGMFAFFTALSMWVEIPENALFFSLGEVFLGLIPALAMWYFVYRGCGTRLLTFYLFLSPAKQIASIAHVVTELYNAWTISFIAIQFGIFLYWYVQSLKMRKINIMLRERRSLA